MLQETDEIVLDLHLSPIQRHGQLSQFGAGSAAVMCLSVRERHCWHAVCYAFGLQVLSFHGLSFDIRSTDQNLVCRLFQESYIANITCVSEIVIELLHGG